MYRTYIDTLIQHTKDFILIYFRFNCKYATKNTLLLLNICLSGLLFLLFSLVACKCNKNPHKPGNWNRRTTGTAPIPKLPFNNRVLA